MIPRLYIDAPLEAGAAAPLDNAQAHYLKNVLRRNEGDEVRLFNGRDGEFTGEIAELKKKGGLVALKEQTRAQTSEPDITLLFAPVKRGALENIIQKATELGARKFQPIITERTVAPKLNVERLQAIAVEAAEQSGRLTVPSVVAPMKLNQALANWPEETRLVFCDEAGDDENEEWGGREGRAAPMLEALKDVDRNAVSWVLLTGPEGGFTPDERRALRDKAFVTPVTLGPRILRADTAVISALTLWQAALGDWR
ncbi:16S rRNA (uracil(1498)-N(3))-methyltransferase [Hyphococcus flavus]|uniref:Ribosomal RNA small subunit methyltransferase E n=1 Tax=Hyphococcus flavus TaxID=1866326 RepID=A0AAE9ZDF8_9PROT|nr:16S rRNA (uracil(1498)-N(3))-methyltransferase [Hyphococcus flavus]WDI32506.1 16S rRNA (uracil(1498)-N(3))-methyltransferase [Hyphococcus flavus]